MNYLKDRNLPPGYRYAFLGEYTVPAQKYEVWDHPTSHVRYDLGTIAHALEDLAISLGTLPAEATAEEIQFLVFEVGKRHAFPELRAWFGCQYQVLLGQAEGPRFGGFVALYGVSETIALIQAALARPPHDI